MQILFEMTATAVGLYLLINLFRMIGFVLLFGLAAALTDDV